MDPVLLKAEEAAALLRIGRSKMYGLLAAAAIPTVRIGRSVRVPRAALLAWITSRTIGPIAPEPPVARPDRSRRASRSAARVDALDGAG